MSSVLGRVRVAAPPVQRSHHGRQDGERQHFHHSRHRTSHSSTIAAGAAPRGPSPSNTFHPESGDRPERFALAEPMYRRHAGGQLPSRTGLQCRLFTTGVASGRAEPDSTRIRNAAAASSAATTAPPPREPTAAAATTFYTWELK